MSKKYESIWNSHMNCHSDNIKVFTDPKSGIIFYGGGLLKGARVMQDALNIDIGSGLGEPWFYYTGCDLPRIGKLVNKQSYGYIKIEWKDDDACYLRKHEWEVLIKDIRESKFKKVLVACIGGHGRTGTALCILAGLMQIPDIAKFDYDPVVWIRSVYCKKAVECEVQANYITKITNLKTKETFESGLFRLPLEYELLGRAGAGSTAADMENTYGQDKEGMYYIVDEWDKKEGRFVRKKCYYYRGD